MAHNIPADLKYTKDHEWAKVEGDNVIIGITDFAQSALGDIVFVELPEVGKTLNAHQSFGVVESIKSVSDLYSPISGTVVEVNSGLQDTPELCNAEPYGAAWMIKVKLSDKQEVNSLLSASDYQNFLSTL
ncbi:MAG: glycine cleavage system protein GcvH [Bacteriovorax sp.]|nr:glycine cleavage system protein GcvH [Bacteriovorax sp.]